MTYDPTSYAVRLDAAKARAAAAYLADGPVDEETVSEIAAEHSTWDPGAPWLPNDLVEIESDLGEYVFSRGWSAEGIPVR